MPSPADVVTDFLARVRRERIDDAMELISDDFELVMGGALGTRFAGRGKGAMTTYLAALRPLFDTSDGTLEVVAVLSDERRAVLVQRQRFTIDGRATEVRRCSEFTVRDGAIVEIANYALAGDELDELIRSD